ncbi:MAG TPA: radical SAM protein [Micromonosporaceae bacterium]|nr:radical SAM protein [Micromonosporaceae bacterium]
MALPPVTCGVNPTLIYFGLFDNCNVKCNMCTCWQLPRSSHTLGHYRSVLGSVLRWRPRAVRFTGGEPLLFRELPALVRQAAEAGAQVSVITNGHLLRAKAAQLRAAGCRLVVVSIDAVGALHDEIRGVPGLWGRLRAGVEQAMNLGVEYGVNTVLQRATIDALPDLAESLLQPGTTPSWWHLIPVRGSPQLEPSAGQVHRFQSMLSDLERAAAERGIRLIADRSMFAESATRPCDVPAFAAYVRADTGSVYGCNMLAYADAPTGNVIEADARDAWFGARRSLLVAACGRGRHAPCARCDRSSQQMNAVLAELATAG